MFSIHVFALNLSLSPALAHLILVKRMGKERPSDLPRVVQPSSYRAVFKLR